MNPVCRELSWDVDAAGVIAAAGPVEHDWELGVSGGICGRPDGEG